MSRFRRIFHPSDFSRASGAAFAKAVALAKRDHAPLVLAHVLAPQVPIAGEGYISPQVYEDLEKSARRYAQKQLGRLVGKARRSGVRAAAMVLTGIPAAAIVRAARSRRADVIVIGTHGRTGLAKFFLGSVASRVIATARCPVLTVRGR